MTLMLSIMIAVESSSGRVNPLRVGLLPGSLPRSDLFYRVYISGYDVNFLLSLCVVYLSVAIIL
uniref:Uncharacterized protein n=1 Tax=Arundo donax TaxID=35708 RepID=A0A0A9D8X7_ARUDO